MPQQSVVRSLDNAPRKKAVIGLRAKTARAIALVLGGTARAPQPIHRAELILSSPRIHATAQPYHEVMDLPWEQAQVAVKESALAIENLAREALAGLLRDVEARGFLVLSLAIVGAPERRLEAIRNPHIRAHAAEGVLYRHVWEIAASGKLAGIESLPGAWPACTRGIHAGPLRLGDRVMPGRLG